MLAMLAGTNQLRGFLESFDDEESAWGLQAEEIAVAFASLAEAADVVHAAVGKGRSKAGEILKSRGGGLFGCRCDQLDISVREFSFCGRGWWVVDDCCRQLSVSIGEHSICRRYRWRS